MGKLLIVDDENDVCEFTKRFFLRYQIKVSVARSGKEALELIYRDNPDLILLDLIMKDMSGIDVLKQSKENHYQAKVIVVSGLVEKEIIDTVMKLGAVDFINKPYLLENMEMSVLKAMVND